MAILAPFNLQQWIADHKDLLKPPVGNACIYKQAGDFIVMVVGGPNSRKDYHYNESEELFYQLEGTIEVKIIEDDQPRTITLHPGDIFLLPAKVPHSPQRGTNTIGLVIEKVRKGKEIDGFLWFCEQCNAKLYEEYMELTDIVKQLPPVMQRFYEDEHKRTCKVCNHVMQVPELKK